jgi:hypothetical protein
MIQTTCSAGLGKHALAALFLAGNLAGKQLERNFPPQSEIESAIDHSHPTASKLLLDAVLRNRLANQLSASVQRVC